ncbi:MAG: sigma-70 family RNA polymerase sigma factor [Planctomycetes bacterium]|nr:sigma-70 family RNA polymerase sigma factor [Planctomycetota bacterium]
MGTDQPRFRLRAASAADPSDSHGSDVGMGPTPEEQELVRLAREGDREAFRVLVEQNQNRIFRLAMRVLHCERETAEDVCQEVFLRAYRALGRFDGKVKFSTWLHTIAMNTSITEYRRRRALKRNKPTFSLDQPMPGADDDAPRNDPPSREVDPSDRVDQQEFAAAVRAAVEDLPDEFRDAVVLRDLQQLSYEEIGAILGVAQGTVRSRIHRGRLILQRKLRDFV